MSADRSIFSRQMEVVVYVVITCTSMFITDSVLRGWGLYILPQYLGNLTQSIRHRRAIFLQEYLSY